MACEAFITKEFRAETRKVIDRVNVIIAQYQDEGLTLSLRQIFYQMVARGKLPNLQREYKRLGRIISDARLAGIVDWDAIEDRGRELHFHTVWDSPASIIDSAASWYSEDLWAHQKYRPEVWIEKNALIGVIEQACKAYQVPYFASVGYNGQSEQYAAGKRFRDHLDRGLKPIVFHLGDHDPSGLDMTRDNRERLSMFANADIEVRRLALNNDQVRRYKPPPNPAKETDQRFEEYRERYGSECWELDALAPNVIDGLIRKAIKSILDRDAWDRALEREHQNRIKLERTVEAWPKIERMLAGRGR